MRKSGAFPSQYLSKEDVATPVIATIADVRMETIQGGEGAAEEKPVMLFQEGHLKHMVLNQINWGVIEDAYGPETDAWRGNRVELYIDPRVMFGGRRVGGVRVRIPAGASVTNPTRTTTPANYLTLGGAFALAVSVGMTQDDLKARLKALGLSSYNPARDTDSVRRIVQAFREDAEAVAAGTGSESLDGPAEEGAPTGSSIPF